MSNLSEPTKAATPFDGDDTDADILLRSSDQVDFRVHKIILSLASPIFKDMFRVPQPAPGASPSTTMSADGLPIINVAEDAHTLEFVLRSCYPVRSPTFSKLSEVRLVLEASTKYEIDAVQAVAEAGLKAVVTEDPLGVFAIACRCDRDDICRLAARHLVHHSLTSLESEELHTISAFPYHKLTQWHRRCCLAAADVALSRTWFLPCEQVLRPSQECSNCLIKDPRGSRWNAPKILWEYLAVARDTLMYCPSGSSIMTENVLGPRDSWTRTCSSVHCKREIETIMKGQLEFSQLLAKEVDRVVSEVPIPSFLP